MKMITERLKFADVFPDKATAVAQRLHIKKDEIPFVRKYYTSEKDKTEVKKKERAVISYISTGIKDRDGEKLIPEGVLLENYQKNPIVPFGHDYRTVPPAKNMWIKRDEKGLIAKTVFAKNQRAEDIYQAYTEDIGGTGPLLNAFSVGFIPLEWEDTDVKALEKDPDLPKRIYNKWELLEYSLVPIPSCPEALTIAIEKNLIPETLRKDLLIEVVKDKQDREITVEKDEPEFESKIAHLDGMVFEPGDWCVDKDGAEWMWDGGWIGRDGRPAKKEISIERAITEPGLEDREIIVEKDEKKIEAEAKKEFAKAVGYLGDLDNLKYEIVVDEEGKKHEKMSTVGKPSGDRVYSKIEGLDWVRVIKGRELFKDEKPITKPETTEKYHHIPVNPGCKITATITISASKGIKATYCGEVKKIHTYLFDVEKWTMDEAKAWVKENKSLETTILALALSDAYDDFMGFSGEKVKDGVSIKELDSSIKEFFTKGVSPEKEEYKKVIKSIVEKADEKKKFNCECIKCGHKLTSDKHCNEIKCPECGGEMRRTSRPGPGRGFEEEISEKEVPEENDFLRGSVSDELKELKGEDREAQQSGDGFNIYKESIKQLQDQHEKLLQEKDDHIADLKAGRVLSRKNRNIVKDAVTALNAVLKADAAGTQEDEESEDGGTVTERTIELEKDTEREFSVEDVKRLTTELPTDVIQGIVEGAFKKTMNPEKAKEFIKEGIRLGIQKMRGVVE